METISEPVGMKPARRVLIYIAFTFGITWAVWITADVIALNAPDTVGSAVLSVAAMVGMLFPLVGALLTNRVAKKGDRIDLKMRPHIHGVGRYYLLAWFLPTVLTVAGGAVFFLVFPSCFDATLGVFRSAIQANASLSWITDDTLYMMLIAQVAMGVLFAPFINMLFAFGEEAGWRGMLFPTLAERFSPRTSVLITGVIWGIWHAPLTVMGHNYGLGYWGYPVTGILCMCVFCVAMGSFLAWLRVRTDSVWSCALCHGAFNAIAGLGVYCAINANALLGPSPAGLIGGIPLIIVGLICWLKLSNKPVQAPRLPSEPLTTRPPDRVS